MQSRYNKIYRKTSLALACYMPFDENNRYKKADIVMRIKDTDRTHS